MKLMESLDGINIENDEEFGLRLNQIIKCIEKRIEKVELSEPISDGSYYDKWEEKLTDLEDIKEECGRLMKCKKENRKELTDSLKKSLFLHQVFYGGLKRLVI